MEKSQLPIQEVTHSVTDGGLVADPMRLVACVALQPAYHEQQETRYLHHLDTKTPEGIYDRRNSRLESLPSPELESQLPSFPPHRVSENFMSVMEQTGRHHPRLNLCIIHNAITLLIKTHSRQFFFPLDHCTIASNGYDILPPDEPVYYDCPSYTNLIKKSNINFILMSIQQVIPSVQCSHLIKQTLEDICEEWSRDSRNQLCNYITILHELDFAFDTF